MSENLYTSFKKNSFDSLASDFQRFGEDFENLLVAHADLRTRESQLKAIITAKMNSNNTFKPINSSSLDDVTVNSDAEVSLRFPVFVCVDVCDSPKDVWALCTNTNFSTTASFYYRYLESMFTL